MTLSTLGALEFQYDFLRRLDFLVENWFGLTTETGLFTVVPPLTLCRSRRLTRLLLPCDSVALVALATFAVCVLLLRVVHHYEEFAVSGVKVM